MHVSIVIPAYLVSAGGMLFAGIQAGLVWLARRQARVYGFFGVMCFCAAGYQLCTAAYYLAPGVAQACTALHWQLLCLCVYTLAFYCFVCVYTGQQRLSPWLGIMAATAVAIMAADLLSDYSLRFSELRSAAPLRMPWGEELGHVAGRGDVVRRASIFVPALLSCAWGLYRARVQYRAGARWPAQYLAVCIGLLVAGGIWGALIDAGVVRSFYVAGFAYIGMVLLMGFSLGQAQSDAHGQLQLERDRLDATRRELERSEMRMSLVLKGTNDAWWDWDLVTGEQYYSDRGWEMLGYPAQALPYDEHLWEHLVYPEDREFGRRLLSEALDSGRDNYSFETRHRHRDGHAVPVLCRGYILRNEHGQAIRISGTDTDLTDRKQAQLALRSEQQLNEQIFANSPVGISIFDSDGNCVAVNAAVATQVGGTTERLLAQNIHTIASWKDTGVYELALTTLRTGEPASGVRKLRTTFGKEIWVSVNFRLLPPGGIGRLMLMTDNLTEFKRAERARREIQDSFEMLFTNSMDGVLQTRADGSVVAVNTALCAMLEIGAEEAIRRGRGLLFDAADPRLQRMIRACGARGSARGEVTMIRGNGERFEVEVSYATYPDHEGRSQASWIVRDITERKKAQQDTHRLAYFDALTGLPNRRLLLDRIAESLEASRRSGQIGALLFLDLDNFKRINDARGHSVGDRFLAQVAQRLRKVLRAPDFVARLGGDEFVVLVNDLGTEVEPSARVAMAVAEKVRAVLESPYTIDGYAYSGTGSIGLTIFPKELDAVDDLLREADTAMYRAKAMGRNRIAYYEAAMQAEVEERLALEQDLKEAIDAGRIGVHVQTQVDAGGNETGGELLLRWEHAQRGPVSPAVFIPIAEESGLILRLGDLVVQRACEALARLQQAGAAITLSVNISPRQFRQEDFVERMREVLARTGAPATRLIFEVTEGLLIEKWEDAARRMSELAALGIRFSIDDFGTGYSSLSYLKKLPLHELKIDRSFVQNTPADANDRAIVQSVLAVAKAFRLTVVAEGVETRAQADFLIGLDCDHLQGYLFARPIPLSEWLDTHAPSPARL
jgi:diguanylate cyclase (GGDEF)-like protein/PAS domain S-box-containing protein